MGKVKTAGVQLGLDKKRTFKQKFIKVFSRDYQLYLLALPAIIYVVIFLYGPMYGLQIAFKDYKAGLGIEASPWNNFEHFKRFFESPQIWDLLYNTIFLSAYALIASFPAPIILALLMNQCGNKKFRKFTQTVIYAPHFISVVVLCGMITVFFSYNSGIVNSFLELFGMEKYFFLGDQDFFPDLYVWSGVWQNAGWGTIIYLASLGAISPEQYEAAKIDGANKWHLLTRIDLPNLLPTIITMLILDIGKFLNVGFQKVFLLQNPTNTGVSEIISTYVYKIGLEQAQFDYAAAIGLFNNVINIILIVSANYICKKISKTSLW